MPNDQEILIATLIMAIVVYLSRITGYLIGLPLRHIPALKPVLEALPGCAFMAILLPAARDAGWIELGAMLAVIVIMWRNNNIALATIVGISILLLGK